MELRQLLTTLRRRWKFVVAIFLSGLVGAFLVSALMTSMYESTARIYFNGSGTAVQDQIQLGVYTAQRVESYAALAHDHTVLESVIDRAGVETTPEALAERTQIEVVPDSVVLRLSVRDADPGVAQKLADAYAAQIATTVAEFETPEATDADPNPSPPVVARIQGNASLASDPVSPNLPLNLAIGALLGLLFGVGGAVLRELLAGEPVPTQPVARPRLPEEALKAHAR